MPELPEVEITRRGIAPFLEGKKVNEVLIRTSRLRFPVAAELVTELPGRTILIVERRAKYLLLRASSGSVILHLGMSGRLDVVSSTTPPQKHDHLDIVMETGQAMRMTDPRRFGLVLWSAEDPLRHPLLKGIGPEPLGNEFNGDYLHRVSRGRSLTVKQFIMERRVVAGIGNIYACEALFQAGIDPVRKAGSISGSSYRCLADAIRQVLTEAIARGENSLGDFGKGSGKAGYFPLSTEAYGREGAPCHRCGALIHKSSIGGRATYFCRNCQR